MPTNRKLINKSQNGHIMEYSAAMYNMYMSQLLESWCRVLGTGARLPLVKEHVQKKGCKQRVYSWQREEKSWGVEWALGEDLRIWSLLPDWRPSPPEPRQPTCTVYNRPQCTWPHCPQSPALRYQKPPYPGPAHFRGWKRLYPCAWANKYSKKDAIHLWDKNAFEDDTRWQSKWQSTGSFPGL